MLKLKAEGHDVVAIGPQDEYVAKIQEAGIPHVAFNVSGDGANPFSELKILFKLLLSLHKEKVELVLSSTPKGNIYAALAAFPLRIPSVPNISGLGRTFIKPGLLTLLVKFLYRVSFFSSRHVIFQNEDDKDIFLKYRLVKPHQPLMVPGSGVSLERFIPRPSPANHHRTFLLVARLLWDKGIAEYVEAARIVRKTYPGIRFQLLGPLGVANPSAIPRETVEQWSREGLVEYLGKTDDVIPYLAKADCVVLPSYREGTPRSLLEAAAMAKPVITTDAVGCRNVVDDTISGYLCKPKDPADLAHKMCAIIEMDEHRLEAMGHAGRRKIEREFDERIVIQRYQQVVSWYLRQKILYESGSIQTSSDKVAEIDAA